MNEYVYKQLINLLQQAAELASQNYPNVSNFDLEDLGQTLEAYLTELDDLGAFEGDLSGEDEWDSIDDY
jgi:hypothetical protein